ncbi:glutamine synthetase family protein [Actinomadura xylanilytica]|uniref:glutamine synthetase family protein n=1 Tax=Actinomadura xylanilytica TaxID=887459 RepID=UPI00255AC709|nr:glutamine synthetase family protein [Actinomadura xylanilytica]MDL4774380.1 glutamine synthetase family protein [Actinomadura xylanilytica]
MEETAYGRDGGQRALDRDERARLGARAAALAAELAGRDVAAVALTWVDISGITRTKAVPVARLEHAATWGVGMSPVFDAFLLDDSIVSGRYVGGPVGDLRLHPDLDRLVPLPALPGWALAPALRYAQDGTVHPLDTRALLRREVARLAALGWSALTAFEVEWTVSEGDGGGFRPASGGPAYGMTRISELAGYLRDLLQALDASGVAVEQIHPEYAAGQYELSVAAEDPVGAADTAVLVRETIRAVSLEHGFVASFSPKVEADSVGNGGHIHLSLWQGDPTAAGTAADGAAAGTAGTGAGATGAGGPAGGAAVNVMAGGDGPYGMTGAGEAFAAGILDRLPALLAVGAPSVASYLRLIPSHWAGAYACWGLENREAALRFVAGADGERARAANLEIKCFDPAANPYLALAALLAAGRAGIGAEAELPEPVDLDPGALSADARADRGIIALPSSLEESVAAFEADPALREALGEAVIDTVAVVRRGEIELLDGATPEEITAATRWRH